jgi:hypothetical protein
MGAKRQDVREVAEKQCGKYVSLRIESTGYAHEQAGTIIAL